MNIVQVDSRQYLYGGATTQKQEIAENKWQDLKEQKASAEEAEEKVKTLSQAIKDYQDEWLTGLTDEERELIDQMCKKYLEENPVKTLNDRRAFAAFIKELLKEFGYKGNYDDFVLQYVNTKEDQTVAASAGPEEVQTEVEYATDSNGERYMVITTSTGQVYKIKMGAGQGKDLNKNPQALDEKRDGENNDGSGGFHQKASGLLQFYAESSIVR